MNWPSTMREGRGMNDKETAGSLGIRPTWRRSGFRIPRLGRGVGVMSAVGS